MRRHWTWLNTGHVYLWPVACLLFGLMEISLLTRMSWLTPSTLLVYAFSCVLQLCKIDTCDHKLRTQPSLWQCLEIYHHIQDLCNWTSSCDSICMCRCVRVSEGTQTLFRVMVHASKKQELNWGSRKPNWSLPYFTPLSLWQTNVVESDLWKPFILSVTVSVLWSARQISWCCSESSIEGCKAGIAPQAPFVTWCSYEDQIRCVGILLVLESQVQEGAQIPTVLIRSCTVKLLVCIHLKTPDCGVRQRFQGAGRTGDVSEVTVLQSHKSMAKSGNCSRNWRSPCTAAFYLSATLLCDHLTTKRENKE